jgi:putative transposase
VSYLVAEHELSVSRATAAVKLSRTAYYRKPRPKRVGNDGPVIDALNELVEENLRWGFWMCFDRLRLDGHPWNHKRVWRVYCEMKLNLPRRKKKRLPQRERQSMEVIPLPNQVWSMDFMSDALYRGRRFRTLNILDEGVREALAIVVDTSIPSGRVIRTLDQLVEVRDKPTAVRCDNGPEFCAQALIDWCKERGIEIRYIQPGKPNQNAFIERFNKSYRDEVLDAHLFATLEQVREISETWKTKYNEYRPHDALGHMPPAMYMRKLKLENSSFELCT